LHFILRQFIEQILDIIEGLLFSERVIGMSGANGIIGISILSDILLILVVCICLYTDLKERKIYNVILLPAFLIGIIINFFSMGLNGLIFSLIGFGVGLLVLIIPFMAGGIGGGDVKLLAVIGSIKGWYFLMYTALGMGIAGGVIAIFILLFRKRLFRTFKVFFKGILVLFGSKFKIVSFNVDDEKYMFPYGVAIAAGVIIAYVFLYI